ncbi:MAG: transglutaminase domain-containing protein [Oscillospiraceae bacterium]|nr:transglutaminase domain-containing protein [Oscillospiraceae bacterium]
MKIRLVRAYATVVLAAGLLCSCASPAAETAADTELVELAPLTAPAGVELGAIPDAFVPLSASPFVSLVSAPAASGTKVKKNGSATIDYSNSQDGYIMACWTEGGTPKIKVQVKGPSGTAYNYNLRTDGQYETFPLSDGNGSYTLGVYKNVSGTQYSTVITETVGVQLTDEFGPFLRPNQYVNFTSSSAAVSKAAQLCGGITDNLEKVAKVYNFVITNTSYDRAKASSVQSGYLPNVDETLSTGKGICFDYAALMCAMLRSQNVPVKLVVGYTGEAYHAWINVYSEADGWIEGKIFFNGREWKLMDPTFASSGNNSDSIREYIGNGANYSAKYQY